jgi:hypothetical protein
LGTTRYRELVLKIQTCDKSPLNNPFIPVYFNGIQKGDYWTFCYPDSLYDKSMYFTIQETTHIDMLSRYIGFK